MQMTNHQQWCGLEKPSCICSCQLCIESEVCCGTVGRCGDGWKLRWIAGEARNLTENALSILIIIFSIQLQQTEISERKLLIFHLGHHGGASSEMLAYKIVNNNKSVICLMSVRYYLDTILLWPVYYGN